MALVIPKAMAPGTIPLVPCPVLPQFVCGGDADTPLVAAIARSVEFVTTGSWGGLFGAGASVLMRFAMLSAAAGSLAASTSSA
jgi:hypothetical protein